MKNKKGELTTKQLIPLIILIASFVVLLYFLFILNLGGTTNAEICRNSVLLNEKSTLISELDCRTNYLCVSGGKNCEGISYTEKIEVKQNQEEVMKALADEMASCWYQFGEGEIDYLGNSVSTKVVCGVCSIVGFDSELAATEDITYSDFYDYLRTTKKDGTQTYLQYLYGKDDLDIFSDFKPQGYLDNKLEFDKQYFILTGEVKEGALSFSYFSHFWQDEFEHNPIPVTILEKTTENYNSVGCGEFITKA